MPRFFKTPHLVRWFFPRRVWSFSSSDNKVYLTFDDGPNREITEWILDLLDEKQVKATFFCVGRNARENPALIDRIVGSGHAIGNHTMQHDKNTEVTSEDYLNSIENAAAYIPSKLFRPPYGRLTMRDARRIGKQYKIIMWTWLSYDFDNKVSTKDILENAKHKIKAGDILVLHDNIKSSARVKELLPGLIEIIRQKGYVFHTISA